MTPEQLDQARMSQALVFDAVMRAIANIDPRPEGGEGAGAVNFFPTVDGLLQTLASLTVLSGAFPTTREKREFADNIRKTLIKHIADAERDIASGNFWSAEPLDRLH